MQGAQRRNDGRVDSVALWLRRGCAGVLAAVAVATPAAASGATVGRPGAATAVRQYGGTIVFSQFDWPTRRWYLSVRRAGTKSPERLGVASSPVSFQADIGTDSAGRPELIYQRCGRAVSTTPPAYELTGCDLFVYSLVDRTGERPVRNANDPAHNDVNATLWQGRIAWTREYGFGEHANPVVYTKTLAAPRSRPSTRLPGVPSTRCGDVDKVCAPTVYRSVEALELRGDDLAAIVRYVCNACGGISQTEVRVDAVADRSSRQVAYLLTGCSARDSPVPRSSTDAWPGTRAAPCLPSRAVATPVPGAISCRSVATSEAHPARRGPTASPTPVHVCTRSSTARTTPARRTRAAGSTSSSRPRTQQRPHRFARATASVTPAR